MLRKSSDFHCSQCLPIEPWYGAIRIGRVYFVSVYYLCISICCLAVIDWIRNKYLFKSNSNTNLHDLVLESDRPNPQLTPAEIKYVPEQM